MENRTEKRYPLSKEEMSLYLACTMNPERKNAYVLGWSLKLPVQGEEREQAAIRLKGATEAVFARHRILCARFCEDGQGSLYKYDNGETPIIEVETRMEETTPEEDNAYCSGIKLDGGRLYRVILVDTPAMSRYCPGRTQARLSDRAPHRHGWNRHAERGAGSAGCLSGG